MRAIRQLGLAATLGVVVGSGALAATIQVPLDRPGIQAAIDAAAEGDVIAVAPGVYRESLDFRGKAVTVVGKGPETIVDAEGAGTVVRFASGEGNRSILDSLLLRGGAANLGGGIYVRDASPTIVRNVIFDNRAVGGGSGIFVDGAAAAPLLYNNLIAYNRSSGGDPHSLEIVGGAGPIVVNNTIVRGDSNGIIVRGPSAPRIVNNIIAFNGSFDSGARGRGICDFSIGGRAVIAFNDFRRNRVAALLRGGNDWRRVTRFQRLNPEEPNVRDNVDGRPGFPSRPPRTAAAAALDDFRPITGDLRAAVIDAGDPSPLCVDVDGTRNDIGFTGGPFESAGIYPLRGDCGS